MPPRPLPPVPDAAPLPGTLWRHYKGGEYEVVTVARREDDLHAFDVIYRPLLDDLNVWSRPLDNWASTVEVDGASVPRFSPDRAGR